MTGGFRCSKSQQERKIWQHLSSAMPHSGTDYLFKKDLGDLKASNYFTAILDDPSPRCTPYFCSKESRGECNRVFRWRRSRNFIIISWTISGLIVIGEILECTEVRRQVLWQQSFNLWVLLASSQSLGRICRHSHPGITKMVTRNPDHSSLALHDGSPKEEEKEKKAT